MGERLPFDDAEFDTIILSDVLEHIPSPEKLWGEMLGSPYHRRYDRSEVFCEKILAHSARFHAVFENLMALDGIKDAVRASEDWLTERRAAFLIAGRMEKLTKALDT